MSAVITGRASFAVTESSRLMRQAGVRHVLIGALAMEQHGFIRSTSNVDWLIGVEGLTRDGLVIRYSFDAPFRIGAFPVRYFAGALMFQAREISDDVTSDDSRLAEAVLRIPHDPDGIEVAPPVYVAGSKLKRVSPKDREDIRQLIQHGAIVVSEMRAWLLDNGASDAGADAAMAKMQRVILEGRAM